MGKYAEYKFGQIFQNASRSVYFLLCPCKCNLLFLLFIWICRVHPIIYGHLLCVDFQNHKAFYQAVRCHEVPKRTTQLFCNAIFFATCYSRLLTPLPCPQWWLPVLLTPPPIRKRSHTFHARQMGGSSQDQVFFCCYWQGRRQYSSKNGHAISQTHWTWPPPPKICHLNEYHPRRQVFKIYKSVSIFKRGLYLCDRMEQMLGTEMVLPNNFKAIQSSDSNTPSSWM